MAEEIGLRLLVGLSFADWRMESAAGRSATRSSPRRGRRAVRRGDGALCRSRRRARGRGEQRGARRSGSAARARPRGRRSRRARRRRARRRSTDARHLRQLSDDGYLTVDGCDLFCLNVFLESAEPFRRYLRHLQVASGGLPVLLTEVGFSSEVLGERAQAELFDEQLRLVDECGCAGALLFAWTDEWAVGDEPVEGWGFGITTEDRRPKPAFEVVERWARADVPRALRGAGLACPWSCARTTRNARLKSAFSRSWRAAIRTSRSSSAMTARRIERPSSRKGSERACVAAPSRRPQRRPERGSRRGFRRICRVPRRGCGRSSRMAVPPRARDGRRQRRGRRTESALWRCRHHRARDRAVTGKSARGSADRRSGRARSRVQHGVPETDARVCRRLRSRLHGGGRRRGCVLEGFGRR